MAAVRRVRWFRVFLALGLLGAMALGAAWWGLGVLVARGTDHTDPTRCRLHQRAWELQRAVEARLTGSCVTGSEQTTAVGLARTIADCQGLYRTKHGRFATGLDELFTSGLLTPGVHVGADGRRAGYSFELTGDGATWRLVARPSCEVCTVGVRSTLEADSRGGAVVARAPERSG